MLNISFAISISRCLRSTDMLGNFNLINRENTPFSVKDILNLSEDTFLNYSSLDKMFMDTIGINCNGFLHCQQEPLRWDVGNIDMTDIYDSPEAYVQDNEYKNTQLSPPSPSSSVTPVESSSSSTSGVSVPIPYCSSPPATSSVNPSNKSECSTKVNTDSFNLQKWPTSKPTNLCNKLDGAIVQSVASASNSK